MFATATKDRVPSGPEYLRAYVADPTLERVPHLAIGGIGEENVPLLAAAGARGVAVSRAVCGSEDPAGACRRLRALLGRG